MRVQWDDMDIITAQLGESNFYVGGGDGAMPKDPAACDTKFCLQMGYTAAAFGDPKKRRSGMNIEFKAGPRGIKIGVPASMLFAERYVRSSPAIQWTPEHIQSILLRSKWKIESSAEEDDTTTCVGEKADDVDAQGSSSQANKGKAREGREKRMIAFLPRN